MGANINKFTQDVLAIKNKIIETHSSEFTYQCLDSLQKIKQEFFKSSKVSLFKGVSNNKVLKALVHLVYNSISYIMSKLLEEKVGQREKKKRNDESR